jgi:hypothetical protein
VLDHLPERDRPTVKQRLRFAWARDDHERALDELRALASELERSYPGADAPDGEGTGVEIFLELARPDHRLAGRAGERRTRFSQSRNPA